MNVCDSILDRYGNKELCGKMNVESYRIRGGIATLKTNLCPNHAIHTEIKLKKHWKMNMEHRSI
jgi:hypothetical protein